MGRILGNAIAERSGACHQIKNFMTNFLRKIFEALDRAAINYALLRGYEDLEQAEASKEVDLLVAPRHLPQLSEILAGEGFVELPSSGHAPHYFFVAYHQQSGAWIKFDVVTDLRYGAPIRAYRIDLAEACLRRRQRCALTYVLSTEDEFFTLFLHCLLDKANFRHARRERLIELWHLIAKDEKIERQLEVYYERYLAPALTWDMLSRAIAANDWPSLLQRRQAVIRRLFSRDPMLSFWRNVSTQWLRRLRPLFFALRRRGSSVALLAPDGAGKSTLATTLTKDPYLQARLIYMGANVAASTVGLPSTQWLHARLKSLNGTTSRLRPDRLLLKALNFGNRLVEQWYRAGAAIYHLLRGRLVVFDRYIYDSWLNKRAATPWKRLRKKLFESICPTPDLVILLDAPGPLLYARKREHTPEWLERQRLAYLNLKERVPQMIVVDATQPPDEVKREVTALIWNHCGRHARKPVALARQSL
jgi:thymidylate kinase